MKTTTREAPAALYRVIAIGPMQAGGLGRYTLGHATRLRAAVRTMNAYRAAHPDRPNASSWIEECRGGRWLEM